MGYVVVLSETTTKLLLICNGFERNYYGTNMGYVVVLSETTMKLLLIFSSFERNYYETTMDT